MCRAIVLLIALALTTTLLAAGITRTSAHSSDWIDSSWTTSPPLIDGSLSAGEWSDATSVDLGAIAGNLLPAYLLMKNDDSYLYVAYDAIGDVSLDPDDHASISFDTYHDLAFTADNEDQFHWGPGAGSGQEHWITGGFMFYMEDSPFDPLLPDHAGLTAAYSLGPSDNDPIPHMLYEIRIPLALIDVMPGEVIGLLGASVPSPGIADNGMFTYSTWPFFVMTMPPTDMWGDLRIARSPQTDALEINPPSQTSTSVPLVNATYTLQVINLGTRNDTYDLDLLSPWNYTLLNSTGPGLLPDTDGDLIPDSGNLTPGSSADFVVQLHIPLDTGCHDSYVRGVSSNNASVMDSVVLQTCIIDAVLDPPHSIMPIDTDVPPNGLYNLLEVTAWVMVSNPGTFVVRAFLLDSGGSYVITRDSTSSYLPAGRRDVTLLLPGWDVWLSMTDGPYLVIVELYDSMMNFLDYDTFMTSFYSYTDFDLPPVIFNPPHSDHGNDTDVPPDAMYDYLDVEVNLTVFETGTYDVFGILLDSMGNQITAERTGAVLSPGNTSLILHFLGRDIFLYGVDGPYDVIMFISSLGATLGTDTYMTGFYSASGFQSLPAAFQPPHSDEAVDMSVPPDGLYEYLIVNASVNVAHSGMFTIDAYLYDLGMNYNIDSTQLLVSLDPGVHEIPLKFSGDSIFSVGIDGPYLVDLWLRDAIGLLDSGSHITGSYMSDDFAPAGARLSPPFSDNAIDTDAPPDGFADYLMVNIGVDVSAAGEYRVVGGLYDQTGWLPIDTDTNTMDCPTGRANFDLVYDAMAIMSGGVDGPYQAVFSLYDEYDRLIDSGIYYTSAYNLSEFQPFDNDPPTSTVGPLPYWVNSGPLDVPFSASDPLPTDGLLSVTLHYRYSTDNSSWGLWTPYLTVPVGGVSSSGTFTFDFPMGAGYYELQTTAVDTGFNSENLGPAESATAFRPIAEISFSPAMLTLTAGQQATVTLQVLSTDGQPATLAAPLVLNLYTRSISGEFRTVGGSTAITTVTIPTGQSSAVIDYYDSAAGQWNLLAYSIGGFGGIGEAQVAAGPAASIIIDPPSASIVVATSLQFTAKVFDSYGNPVAGATVIWNVSGGIGSVSNTGNFTGGIVAGFGTVIASCNALQDSADVMLTPGPPSTLRIVPMAATIRSGTDLFLVIEVFDTYGNNLNATGVTWSVSGPASLSISTGARTTLTANSVGIATVTATLGGLSTTATLTSVEISAPQPSDSTMLIAGALLGGLAIGFLIGAILFRRQRKPVESKPQEESPPESQESPPGQ